MIDKKPFIILNDNNKVNSMIFICNKYPNFVDIKEKKHEDICININSNASYEEEKKLQEIDINLNESNNIPTNQINNGGNNKEERDKNEEKELEDEDSKEKKILGKKRKASNIRKKHNKFWDDNLRRKIKHIILSNLMTFINRKIYELYNGDLGEGILIKKLLTLNQQQTANAIIDYNIKFLDKKIGEIFSENISTSYTNYPKEHNKKLIKKLTEEEDINKRIYFINLFNLTFLQCLKHFRKNENIKELDGFIDYNEYMKQFNKEKDYKECLEYYIHHYEEIIRRKKSRKRGA
jgi:hypothetical protein